MLDVDIDVKSLRAQANASMPRYRDIQWRLVFTIQIPIQCCAIPRYLSSKVILKGVQKCPEASGGVMRVAGAWTEVMGN